MVITTITYILTPSVAKMTSYFPKASHLKSDRQTLPHLAKVSDAMIRAAIMALYDACGDSTNNHVPEEAVVRRVRSDMRGDMKDALKVLIKNQYAQRHPTGGTMTYNITQKGLDFARSVFEGNA